MENNTRKGVEPANLEDDPEPSLISTIRGAHIAIIVPHSWTLLQLRTELVSELVSQGARVTAILPSSENDSLIKELGAEVLPIKLNRRGKNPLQDLFLTFRYISLFRSLRPDVILSYTIKPNLYGGVAARVANIPFVANITGRGQMFLQEGLNTAALRLLYRRALKRAAMVYFQNRGDIDYFKKYRLLSGPSKLIPGSGVNLERFKLAPYPQNIPIQFLFVGRLLELKGIEEFLWAAKQAMQEGLPSEFHVVGTVDDQRSSEMINSAVKEGTVIHHSHLMDVRPALIEADCLIMPSRGGEGVPNVVLEASATGRPSIGTQIPGIVDVIEDGQTGFLFPAGDREELLDRVRKFTRLSLASREKMGVAARNKVESRFDRKLVVQEYVSLLKSILIQKG